MTKPARIIFVTGTDTGVGKTLFTALLLDRLRRTGNHALAMKPFCSGGTADVRLLQSLQPGELSDAEMNPFYYEAPLAPLVAARRNRQATLSQAVRSIRTVAGKCGILLVEGSGGLMVPLGPNFLVLDLIAALKGEVILVARNRLGTINHTLLTVAALKQRGLRGDTLRVVLMGVARPDLSAKTNLSVLKALLGSKRVSALPYLGPRASRPSAVRTASRKLGRLLAV